MGASRYAVSLFDGSRYQVVHADIKDTQYLVTGLTPDVEVRLLVQAQVNGRWSSDRQSLLVKAKPTSDYRPPAPRQVEAYPTYKNGELQVSWGLVDGAERYAVSIRTRNPLGPIQTLTTNQQDAQYLIEGLQNDQSYAVLVQAHLDGKWSGDSFTYWVTGMPEVDEIIPKPTVIYRGNGCVGLRWSLVSNHVERYAVSVLIDGVYRVLTTNISSDTNIYVAKNLPMGKPLRFLVQAYSNGTWSSDDVAHTVATGIPTIPQEVPKPEIFRVDAADASARVIYRYGNINNYDLIERYAVSLYENGAYRVIDSNIPKSQTEYVLTGLQNGKKVGVLVQAYLGGRWSSDALSNVRYVTPQGGPVPSPGFQIREEPNALDVRWNMVPGATRYAVSLLQNDGSYRVINANLDKYESSYWIRGLTNWLPVGVLVQAQVNGRWSSDDQDFVRYATPQPKWPKPPSFTLKRVNSTTVRVDLISEEKGYEDVYFSRYAVAVYSEGGYRLLNSNVGVESIYINNLAPGRFYHFLVQGYSPELKSWSPDLPQFRKEIYLNQN